VQAGEGRRCIKMKLPCPRGELPLTLLPAGGERDTPAGVGDPAGLPGPPREPRPIRRVLVLPGPGFLTPSAPSHTCAARLGSPRPRPQASHIGRPRHFPITLSECRFTSPRGERRRDDAASSLIHHVEIRSKARPSAARTPSLHLCASSSSEVRAAVNILLLTARLQGSALLGVACRSG